MVLAHYLDFSDHGGHGGVGASLRVHPLGGLAPRWRRPLRRFRAAPPHSSTVCSFSVFGYWCSSCQIYEHITLVFILNSFTYLHIILSTNQYGLFSLILHITNAYYCTRHISHFHMFHKEHSLDNFKGKCVYHILS